MYFVFFFYTKGYIPHSWCVSAMGNCLLLHNRKMFSSNNFTLILLVLKATQNIWNPYFENLVFFMSCPSFSLKHDSFWPQNEMVKHSVCRVGLCVCCCSDEEQRCWTDSSSTQASTTKSETPSFTNPQCRPLLARVQMSALCRNGLDKRCGTLAGNNATWIVLMQRLVGRLAPHGSQC